MIILFSVLKGLAYQDSWLRSAGKAFRVDVLVYFRPWVALKSSFSFLRLVLYCKVEKKTFFQRL
jgi:hypothetical protein